MEVHLLPQIAIHETNPDERRKFFILNDDGTKNFLKWRVSHPYDSHKVQPLLPFFLLFFLPWSFEQVSETWRQFAVDPLLIHLRHITPEDAFAVVGITFEDLYEGKLPCFPSPHTTQMLNFFFSIRKRGFFCCWNGQWRRQTSHLLVFAL
jgi:hypothetical protein